MSTYKELLKEFTTKELIERHRETSVGWHLGEKREASHTHMIEAELLHRLNEAERLREIVDTLLDEYYLQPTAVDFMGKVKDIIEQALTTPEGERKEGE